MTRIPRGIWKVVCILILMLGLGGSNRMVFADHPAYVAGQFYPEDPLELKSEVQEFLKGPESPKGSSPAILMVPHAGYIYSGAVAGRAFHQIEGKNYPLVILIAVAHRYPVSGAATQTEGAFRTPLGSVSVDTQAVRRLMELSPSVIELPGAFYQEHSLEVELPFLQVALSQFKIVPLLMTRPDLGSGQDVGDSVAALVQEKAKQGIRTLIVVSSDFAHYPKAEDAKKSDLKMVDEILKVSPEGLHETSLDLMRQGIPSLETTACGEAGLLAGLYAARALGGLTPELLQHATSAESSEGSADRTVGYASIIFYQKDSSPLPSQKDKEIVSSKLSEEDKKKLLQLARKSVEDQVLLKKKGHLKDFEGSQFRIPKAVFVTLTKHGELRGCIGSLMPQMPLAEAVAHYAILAATEDHRFSPVSAAELKELNYEVSILSEAVKVKDVQSIRPKIDGVILTRGPRQGVFLPQVWHETGWTKEEFLSQLASQKAGLPRLAWQDPATELFVFQVDAFKESEAESPEGERS